MSATVTIRTLTGVDALARDVLAATEPAGLYSDPDAVIAQMAARITELRGVLNAVSRDWINAEKALADVTGRCDALCADNKRLHDTVTELAAGLARTGR
ncbi:hypothetical protein [Nocardia tengchongensis]|uniref:hypothetical protein n=1 Tax=Nocardia tengchongensis TaxID=2055889 RepID=UPI0036BE5384